MFEDYLKELRTINGWTIEGEKVKAPLLVFPDEVFDRISFFAEQMEDGLMFTAALDFIFAFDEERQKSNCLEGGSWLPVSDEFKKWRDTNRPDLHQEQVALGLIYGYMSESEAKQRNLI